MKAIKSLAAAAIAVVSFAPMASVGATTIGDFDSDSLETISSVNVTVASPKIGTTVTATTEKCTYEIDGQIVSEWDCTKYSIIPSVSIANGEHYYIGDQPFFFTDVDSMLESGDADIFTGTFAANTNYYAELWITPEDGYAFADDVDIKINNGTDFVLNNSNASGILLYARLQATTTGSDSSSETATSGTTYETLNGADQTFYTASDSGLTFRFNIDYTEFQESGNVYMDGEIVNSTNYTTKSGSTIITFNDSYTNSLSAGDHTMRVVTANGEATTSFTLKKSKNPKTGLEVASSFILLGASATGLAGAAIYAKKSSKNA